MSTTTRWTSADLESMPDDGTRYEIIDGELYMSKQPHIFHQFVCSRLVVELHRWNQATGLGQVVYAPGLIFAHDNDVAPDVVWLTNERLSTALSSDGKLHDAPELVIEVLSPGPANERRDRAAKLQLYSRQGVTEYWIVDWIRRSVDVYRSDHNRLQHIATLGEDERVESPLFEGLSFEVRSTFENIPRTD